MVDLGKTSGRLNNPGKFTSIFKRVYALKSPDYISNYTILNTKDGRRKSIVPKSEDNDTTSTIQNRQTIQSKIERCFETFIEVEFFEHQEFPLISSSITISILFYKKIANPSNIIF